MSPRDYNSPARDAAKEETRQAILDALIRVVLDEGVHAFTMSNVAKRAGVSLRTVYRHFESREALLDGLSADLEARMSQIGLPSQPPDIEFLRGEGLRAVRHLGGDNQERVTAYVIVSIALGRQAPDAHARSAAYGPVFDAAFPHLSAAEREQGMVMVRHITSSRTWFALTVERDLSADTATDAMAWAVRVLIDDLTRRNRDAAPRSP